MIDVNVLKLFIWMLLCSLDGARDAINYFLIHGRNKPKVPIIGDEHTFYAAVRIVLACVVIMDIFNFWLLVSLWLMLPFLHNGMYYTVTNILYNRESQEMGHRGNIIYPNWYLDHSPRSTSMMNFSVLSRTIMFVIGFILFFLIIRNR